MRFDVGVSRAVPVEMGPDEMSIGRIHRPLARVAKRAFDLAIALPVALFTLPIILSAALLVKIASPGSAFYYQTREGFLGRPIRVMKIRTMVVDAERRLSEYLASDPDAQSEWQRTMKLRRDPRVVPGIGAFLRKSSIDELPQIYNVLKGEMSIVGPRPFPEYHLRQFSPNFRSLRHQVKPGITGLWQISSRSDGDLETQEAKDTWYVRNWSLWLDIWILLRTPAAVLFGKGAY